MRNYPITIGHKALSDLAKQLKHAAYTQILVLMDQHTLVDCYPLLKSHLPTHQIMEILPGETHKNLETCVEIWREMTQLKLDRRSVVINLGGGVIGDMGGFVASTFKRGIDFIQVPTTLLAQVDASVGGKLGIDFDGYKNHIGMFKEPQGVFIDPRFLQSLPEAELRSGFAEVIKHHLIADGQAWEDLKHLRTLDPDSMEDFIRHSVHIKESIVESDPTEKGLRKALNFGHTVGHAVEGDLLQAGNPILHGEAVALGMVAESWISHQRGMLSERQMSEVDTYIRELYPPLIIDMDRLDVLYERAQNDKKNIGGEVNCTLLTRIGEAVVNQKVSKAEMAGALQFWNQA